MSSSTAFPLGEVFRFAFSANGQLVLCISSSRVVVLEVAADPVAVRHELKTRRRPLGATIKDDGSLLAVLSSTHRVNIYRLSSEEAKHIQTITLNDAPRDLTFSPTGSVLALSFENNIEVFAVGEGTLSTERRAARCPCVDALSFSPDGSMLLGSSLDRAEDSIFTITAPFYTEPGTDASPEEVQMRMWTTPILFPETTRGFTHACLIDGHGEADDGADDGWVLGYDSRILAFRTFKIKDSNAGNVYFANPFLAGESREMLPIMLPSIDNTGELAAFGFQDSEVWIYGVPKRLDVAPASSGPETRIGGDHHSDGREVPRDNLAQLEKIVRQPRALIRGRRVTEMHGITSARWARSTRSRKSRRRLVAVAPGGVRSQAFGGEDVPVDGGRVLLLDFERSTSDGEEAELDIEVGEIAPKMLAEPDSSLDTEVELERRRTRLRRPNTDPTLTHRTSRFRGSQRPVNQTTLPHHYRNSLAIPHITDGISDRAVPEIPYDNTLPRSRDTLHRAATAAASTRERHGPYYRSSPSRHIVPLESDADIWEPPPPPYSREPDRPLPDHLRQTLLPRSSIDPQTRGNASAQPVQRTQTAHVARSISPDRPRPHSAIFQRLGSITNSRRPRRSLRDFTAADGSPSPDQANNPEGQITHQSLATNAAVAINHRPVHPNTSATSSQPLPTLAVHAAESSQQATVTTPPVGATILDDSHLPYSVSSPNLLHIPQPHGNALDVSEEDDAQIPERRRSFRRRVSTEPPSLPPPENEDWRRRIEDWNEHTIRERSRNGRRNKCIVM